MTCVGRGSSIVEYSTFAQKTALIEDNLLFSLKFAFAIIKAITPHLKPSNVVKYLQKARGKFL